MARKAGLTHTDIVDAAVAVVDEEGFESLTLAGVAAKLGVQPPSLYHHVQGVDGLRRAVVRRAIEVFSEVTAGARAGRQGADAFVAYAQVQRDLARSRPGLYAAINATRYIADDTEMWEALLAALEPIMETLREIGLEEGAVLEALRLFRATTHGFLVLELRGDFGFDLDVDASYERLVHVVLTGLQSELAGLEDST
jgi:AcrR family transcriptional regulator